MTLLNEISQVATAIPAEIKEKKGIFEMTAVIAERKTFLSKKKLQYIARFRINEAAKEVKFTEMLKESGWGLSSGGNDMSPGFGFKTESYNTMNKGREGLIEEQSALFGKNYSYKFDCKTIRAKFEELAKAAGYEFKYQITPVGL
jgi:hypothetical protein